MQRRMQVPLLVGEKAPRCPDTRRADVFIGSVIKVKSLYLNSNKEELRNRKVYVSFYVRFLQDRLKTA